MRHGFLSLLSLLLLSLTSSLYAAQTLNNPIGADGCYIVRWDCERNAFAAANDFEADETFTFAIDLTSTEWVEWLQQQGSTGTRGIATNFSTNHGDIARGADRLFHIQGNIYGKTINLADGSSLDDTVIRPLNNIYVNNNNNNVMLSKGSQSPKITYCMILLM